MTALNHLVTSAGTLRAYKSSSNGAQTCFSKRARLRDDQVVDDCSPSPSKSGAEVLRHREQRKRSDNPQLTCYTTSPGGMSKVGQATAVVGNQVVQAAVRVSAQKPPVAPCAFACRWSRREALPAPVILAPVFQAKFLFPLSLRSSGLLCGKRGIQAPDHTKSQHLLDSLGHVPRVLQAHGKDAITTSSRGQHCFVGIFKALNLTTEHENI